MPFLPLLSLLRRLRSLLVSLFLVLVLLVGNGIWLPALAITNGELPSPATAIFVPRQAPVMISLLTNPQQILTLQSRQGKLTSGGRENQLYQILQATLQETGIEFNRDLQPWVGEELTLAITSPDFDRQPKNGLQPGYLLALTVQSPQRAQAFLERYWQQQTAAGRKLQTETVQGVRLTSIKLASGEAATAATARQPAARSAPAQPLATASVGQQFVLLANDLKVLRNAVNNAQAIDQGIAATPFYQQALAALDQERQALVVLNLPELQRWRQTLTPEPKSAQPTRKAKNKNQATDRLRPQTLEPQLSEPQIYDHLVLTVGQQPSGLVIDTALMAAAGAELPTDSTSTHPPLTAANYLPGNTALAVAGYDLPQTWEQLTQGLASYPVLERLANKSLAATGQQWHLNPTDDLFAWAKSDYSLGVVPPGMGKDKTAQVKQAQSNGANWLFAAKQSVPRYSETAIEHLSQIAEMQGLNVTPQMLNTQEVVAWTHPAEPAIEPQPARKRSKKSSTQTPKPVTVAAATRQSDYTLLGSSTEVLATALGDESRSFRRSPGLRQLVSASDPTARGYLYLDWPTLRPLLEQQLPLLQALEALAPGVFENLGQVSLTSYERQERLQHSLISVQLAP